MSNEKDLPGELEIAINAIKQIFPHTMDANVWAIEFMKCVDKGMSVDEDWMRGWFANAIMAGYDTFRVKQPEPSIPLAELKSWCEENSLVSDKGNDYVLCDDLLARFCKEGRE